MARKFNERDLSRRLREKDKGAIGLLYDEYAPALYGIVLRIVHSEAVAQDVVQETFIKAWKKGGDFDSRKGTLFTWLLNIARNGAIDKTRSAAFRQQKNGTQLTPELANHHRLSTVTETDQIGLRGFVNQLEDKYKEVIELAYFKGFTQQEIAEQLCLPLGTVKSRARIALRELRKIFLEPGITRLIIVALSLAGVFLV